MAEPRTTDRAEALGAAFPPLVVAAERVAATVLQGVHGRRRAGQGDAFWQFRPFIAGDAASRIDWRQSARTDRLFIRETEWEAAQTVLLWRNAGASMDYPLAAGAVRKRERADLLLMALASLLLRGGERVRLFGAGAPARSIAGRGGLERLAEALALHPARAALPLAEPGLPRHARAVLFSDFWTPLEELQATVAQLASVPLRGQLVQVVSPEEEELAGRGHVRFLAPEGEDSVTIRRVETARQAWPEIIARHRAGVQAIAAAAGWGFLVHRTDKPPEAAVLALWQALAPEPRQR